MQQIEHLEKYDTSQPHIEVPAEDSQAIPAEVLKVEDDDHPSELSDADRKSMDSEKRAAWRRARLQSLENDAIQAQIVIEKMSQLVATDSSTDSKGRLKTVGCSAPPNFERFVNVSTLKDF